MRRPIAALVEREARTFPVVHRATVPGVPLARWVEDHRATFAADLHTHGAVLMRGFAVDVPAFEAASAALFDAPLDPAYPELGGRAGDAAQHPTPYPADEPIPFHNEGAHRATWPRFQAFMCRVPADDGGATPLVDGRALHATLPAPLAARLADVGVRYTRRFVAGLDVTWEAFFGSADREAVTAACAAAGEALVWRDDGPVHTAVRPAYVVHPELGEALPFHQILVHHPRTLPPRLRTQLAAAGRAPPRDAGFGDGARLDDATLDVIADAYRRVATRFTWHAGDVLALDNVRVAHGRDAYRGARALLVALARGR